MRSERDTLPGDPPGEAETVTNSTAPRSAQAVSSARASRTQMIELPVVWLEGLLLLWSELPVAAGDRAVVRAMVDSIAALLPEHDVASCLVPADGRGQEVLYANPARAGGGRDPTRLFPRSLYEQMVEIDSAGSTLHIACREAACADDHLPIDALVARAGVIARRGLELARVQARAAGAVAELRSLNAQMVQAEKLASLGQIAAGVVHELNNPLTSIVAYTDYLIRKAEARGPDGDEVDRLQRIAESAGRMLRFTRDLVSYARPSSEVPVPVSVHMAIDQAVAFCEHVIADAEVTVVRRYTPSPAMVCGKPEQLAQIFVNLITNACHAMADAGDRTLTLSTRLDDGRIIVEIGDSGHGILPEHLSHVFTPFFTTKTSGAGTGLGLAIVKSIVDGHGGEIHVASNAGTGATFSITLAAT
ncbi:MAG TPA: ATP-binding protein [Polyangiaceae bacterium]|jgi:signal transduction histidine kinase